MTSAIVLPTLDLWAQQHLTALIQAKTQKDVDTAFDNFIAQDVKITFNGVSLTRDQYKKPLLDENHLKSNITVDIASTVQAPKLHTNATQDSGLVGLFYNLTVVEPGTTHETRLIHSSLNIQVAQDTSIPLPPAGIRGDVDRRRVIALDQVFVDDLSPTLITTTGSS